MANKVISSVNNGLNSAQNISQRKSHPFRLCSFHQTFYPLL